MPSRRSLSPVSVYIPPGRRDSARRECYAAPGTSSPSRSTVTRRLQTSRCGPSARRGSCRSSRSSPWCAQREAVSPAAFFRVLVGLLSVVSIGVVAYTGYLGGEIVVQSPILSSPTPPPPRPPRVNRCQRVAFKAARRRSAFRRGHAQPGTTPGVTQPSVTQPTSQHRPAPTTGPADRNDRAYPAAPEAPAMMQSRATVPRLVKVRVDRGNRTRRFSRGSVVLLVVAGAPRARGVVIASCWRRSRSPSHARPRRAIAVVAGSGISYALARRRFPLARSSPH